MNNANYMTELTKRLNLDEDARLRKHFPKWMADAEQCVQKMMTDSSIGPKCILNHIYLEERV